MLFTVALPGGMTLPWAVGQIASGYSMRSGLVLAPVAFFVILVIAFAMPKLRTRIEQPQMDTDAHG
jgi:hypothetical protein